MKFGSRAWRVAISVATIAGGLCSGVSGCTDHRSLEGATGTKSQAALGDGLVISQVSPELGPYNQRFVELFNRSSVPVSLGGLSIQWGGNGWANLAEYDIQKVVLPDAMLGPGSYYLIGFGPQRATGLPLAADFSTTQGDWPIDATDKIAVVRGTTPPGCGGSDNRCPTEAIADLIGWINEDLGEWAEPVSDYEGRPTLGPNPKGVVSLGRKRAGCVDTDDNLADIEMMIPAPRNSATPMNTCTSDPVDAGPSGTRDGGADAGNGLVVSQIFGTPGVGFNRSFIELHNRSDTSVPLSGLSVQYQSDFGNFDRTGTLRVAALPDAVVPPGGYFLIGCNREWSGIELPSVDVEAPNTMPVGTIGRVALARSLAPLACGASDRPCTAVDVVDLVRHAVYGDAFVRRSAGCTDTDDDVTDFVTSAATPRSSTSPIRRCPNSGGSGLVISQIFNGGAAPGATYNRDFVELFNRSSAPLSLAGFSLQHAGGGSGFTSVVVLPDVALQPGGYFLVGYRPSPGASGAAFTADFESISHDLVPHTENVALARVTSTLGCSGFDCTTDEVVDLVGAGRATLEGNPTPVVAPIGVTSVTRKNGGCTDTDNNAADFDLTAPVPRGTQTAPHPCDPRVGYDGGADAGSDPSLGVGLVISQVFGGGGGSGAAVNRDYVELLNRSGLPVSLAGLSLQFGAGARDFGHDPMAEVFVLPDIVVESGRYFLIGLGSNDTATGIAPSVDVEAPISLGADNGKVALARITAPLWCGGTSRCPATNLVDLVGYGAGTDFEGSSPAPMLSNTSATLRANGGCTDTNDNLADFVVATPLPRNGSTPAIDCSTLPPTDAGFDSGHMSDAGLLDSGVPHPVDSGGAPSPLEAGLGRPTEVSGCSCRATPGGEAAPGGMALLGAAVGLALGARRRR